MPRFSFRVDGLTEAKAAIDALPQAFVDVVSETLDEGGDIIFNEAYTRVPVDNGTLQRSLGKNVRADGLQVAVGTGDPIARFVEFETNDTPAQPFLLPAFRLGARYIRAQIKEWTEEAGALAKRRGKPHRLIKGTSVRGKPRRLVRGPKRKPARHVKVSIRAGTGRRSA